MNDQMRIIKYSVTLIVIFVIVLLGLTINRQSANFQKSQPIVTVGISKRQHDDLTRRIAKAMKDQQYLNLGDKLLKEGKIDEALQTYEVALSNAKLSADKGIIINHMANAYEKKRDYEKALEFVKMNRDQYVNSWAKAPIEERVLCLNYALEGNYEMAVGHAQKAVEIFKQTFPNIRRSTGGYEERLNDLKASKDYIMSLKKK